MSLAPLLLLLAFYLALAVLLTAFFCLAPWSADAAEDRARNLADRTGR